MIWEMMHSKACQHADEVIFANNESPILIGSQRYRDWLFQYDSMMFSLNQELKHGS